MCHYEFDVALCVIIVKNAALSLLLVGPGLIPLTVTKYSEAVGLTRFSPSI